MEGMISMDLVNEGASLRAGPAGSRRGGSRTLGGRGGVRGGIGFHPERVVGGFGGGGVNRSGTIQAAINRACGTERPPRNSMFTSERHAAAAESTCRSVSSEVYRR